MVYDKEYDVPQEGHLDGMDMICCLLVLGRGKSIKWWPLRVGRFAWFRQCVQLGQYIQLGGSSVNQWKV